MQLNHGLAQQSEAQDHPVRDVRCPPLLMVVEGIYDIHFITALSAILHQSQPDLPDLGQAEAQGKLVLLPAGGGNLKDWVQRIGLLQQRQFHLYDREQEPETSVRRKLLALVNQRPGCVAALTKKRALENYLHPQAIMQASGIELCLTDDSDVPALLAQQMTGPSVWPQLSSKGQKRLREKAKKVLNVQAVPCMTAELLAAQDPDQELIGWLRIIARSMG